MGVGLLPFELPISFPSTGVESSVGLKGGRRDCRLVVGMKKFVVRAALQAFRVFFIYHIYHRIRHEMPADTEVYQP